MNHNFFKGLQVIELASVLAGPAVGQFFSELGATVIKIENKNTDGDITRKWKLSTEDANKEYSAYYCSVNWNKHVMQVDLRNPTEQKEVFDLIVDADIVVSNFKLKSAKKMGVDYESLKKINPEVIFGQINAFPNGEERPAFDIVLQAEAGFLFMTGEAHRPPVRMPVALIDLLTAHQLKEGLLMALLQKEKTGKGSYVETSLLESAIASLANQATNWLIANHIPKRMGSQHPNIAPYGDIFQTKDNKDIVLAIGTEKQFTKLCLCLNQPNLYKDPDFDTNAKRVSNRANLNEILAIAIKQFDRDTLFNSLTTNQVPVGRIFRMDEVFDQPDNQELLLEQRMSDGAMVKSVKTIAFNIKSS